MSRLGQGVFGRKEGVLTFRRKLIVISPVNDQPSREQNQERSVRQKREGVGLSQEPNSDQPSR